MGNVVGTTTVIGQNFRHTSSLPDLDPIDISNTENMSVWINGTKYTGSGRSLSVNQGRVYIDGVLQQPLPSTEGAAGAATTLTLKIIGNVASSVSTTSGDVTVEGDVQGSVGTMSGDATVEGHVRQGNVSTMSGDVTVRGSIKSGKVSTMSGRIRHVKKDGVKPVKLKKKKKDGQ